MDIDKIKMTLHNYTPYLKSVYDVATVGIGRKWQTCFASVQADVPNLSGREFRPILS
jgi:hypothetical protein